jgi:hypothetical protein
MGDEVEVEAAAPLSCYHANLSASLRTQHTVLHHGLPVFARGAAK